MTYLKVVMVAAVVMMAVTLVGCAAPSSDPAALIEGANRLDQAFLEAFNTGDAEALAGLYWNHSDAVSFPPDVLQARGVDAIRQANAALFEGTKGARLEIIESHQVPAGDVVMGWGVFKYSAPGADGKVSEMTGRFSDVKAERDGKWVYLMDHGSFPVGAAPTP